MSAYCEFFKSAYDGSETFMVAGHCAECGWPVLACHVTETSQVVALVTDRWCYCSNLGCKNHTGAQGYFPATPGRFFAKDLKRPIISPALGVASNGTTVSPAYKEIMDNTLAAFGHKTDEGAS